THVRTTVASRYASKALEVIADLIQHPRFRTEDMDAERRIILDEIASTRADPIRFLVSRLYATALPTHPYRFELTGPREPVLALKQPQLKEYFQKNYALSNSVLI